MEQTRMVEWLCATFILSFGVALFMPPDIIRHDWLLCLMLTQGYTEQQLGIFTMAVAVIWMFALFLHEHWRRAPWLRLTCSIAGIAITTWVTMEMLICSNIRSAIDYIAITIFMLLACMQNGHEIGMDIWDDRYTTTGDSRNNHPAVRRSNSHHRSTESGSR